MQIVILGASNTGISLAKRLSKNNDIVLVDENASDIVLRNELDVVAVDGIIIDLGVLEEAGLRNADIVCALSSNENSNLMASQIAKKKFGVDKVVTCVYDTEQYDIFEELGIIPISATDLTVDAFCREILEDPMSEFGSVGICTHNLFGREFKFKMFSVAPNFIGYKLKALTDSEGGIIISLIRDGEFIQYSPDIKIEEGDRIAVAVSMD